MDTYQVSVNQSPGSGPKPTCSTVCLSSEDSTVCQSLIHMYIGYSHYLIMTIIEPSGESQSGDQSDVPRNSSQVHLVCP